MKQTPGWHTGSSICLERRTPTLNLLNAVTIFPDLIGGERSPDDLCLEGWSNNVQSSAEGEGEEETDFLPVQENEVLKTRSQALNCFDNCEDL